MSLVTVQRSPSPSNNPESDDGVEDEVGDELDDSSLKSPGRQRRSESAKKRLKKYFNTVRFISKLQPCFSESYFAVKGAALILPQSDVTDHTYTQKIVRERHAGVGTVTGDIQSHLQSMFYLLRSQDTIKVAVKLETQHEGHNRYMAVVSCFGKQDTEESVILGIDCNNEATIGLVLPIWADTSVKLNGDGGFMVISEGKQHIFKPVSVQAMWSALQSLNKVVKISRDNTYIPRGLTHTWVGYYNSRIHSDRACISEWFTSEELQEWRSSNILFMDPGDTPDDVLQKKIKTELKNIMMAVDLDEVTSKFLREALEEKLKIKLQKHKNFVEQEMMTILGQMDSPTMIKDYLYLGSEFNASNLEELDENGVDHILNISREVDNFFPEKLTYLNIKEWDNEEADLRKHWDVTNKFIAKTRRENSKVLVHCKMGISRSASTVMAYLMKEYDMTRKEAYDFVKAKRACVMPNDAFWDQLHIYEGILNANKQRALFKSKSEQNLISTPPIVEKEEEDNKEFIGHPLIKDDLFLPGLPPHDEFGVSAFHTDIITDKDKDIMFDIENSSRSTDSTEESLDLPSPKLEGMEPSWKAKYGVYVVESNKVSADGPDTDSSCLTDEDDMDFGETDTDNLYGKQLEKNQSHLAASTKFKPDHSWIKKRAETIDETDQNPVSPDESKGPISESVPSEEEEMVDITEEPSTTKSVTIEAAVEELVGKSEVELTPLDKPREEGSSSTQEKVEIGVKHHYIKENIPWNPGTVKKQLQDIEGKSKEVISEDTTESTGDRNISADSTVAEDTSVNVGTGESRDEVQACDSQVQETKLESESPSDEEKPVLKRSASVYEIEEITLPTGIVKKTTQEIEERNKQSDSSPESPHLPLQRSSSLKEERVTPKRKRSERRKTCTPILSPSSTPQSSDNDTTPCSDVNEFVFPPKGETKVTEPREVTVSIPDLSHQNGASKNTEDSQPTDVAVYKYGSEEVPVEKGIVKKQKMDIEQKARDRHMSDSRTPDSDKEVEIILGQRKEEDTKEIATASKPTVPTSKDIPDKVKVKDTEALQDTKEVVGRSGPSEELSEKGSQSLSDKNATSSIDLDDSGRFDSETLELIREVGSAFLNSPSKAEKETESQEQVAKHGGSLVKFLVRNIEKNTAVTKKKQQMEIIIIEKDTVPQEKKKTWRFSNPPVETTSPSFEKPRVSHSNSSPALSVPVRPKEMSLTPCGTFSSSPPRTDPTQKLAAESPQSVIEQESLTDKSSAECKVKEKVKDLVGKFEHTDGKPPTGKSGSVTTPSEEILSFVLKEKDSNSTKPDTPHPEGGKMDAINKPLACGAMTSQSHVTSPGDDDSDEDECVSEQSVQLRQLRQNLRKAYNRPKSADHIRRCYSTSAQGAQSYRPRLKHAHTLPTPTNTEQLTFSWEGRKVRKLHGKSHPLTKLQHRHSFYNTM